VAVPFYDPPLDAVDEAAREVEAWLDQPDDGPPPVEAIRVVVGYATDCLALDGQ
jgi:hypothetical protein